MEFLGTCDVSVSVVRRSGRFEECRAFISKGTQTRALHMKRHSSETSWTAYPVTQHHIRSCSVNSQYHYDGHQNSLLNTWARSSQSTRDTTLGPFRRPVRSRATATTWPSAKELPVGFSWRSFLIAQMKFSEAVATLYIFRDKVGNECAVTRDTNITSNLGRNWAFESKLDEFEQTEK